MSLADTTRERLAVDLAKALVEDSPRDFPCPTGIYTAMFAHRIADVLAEKIIYRDQLERIHQIRAHESDGAPLIAHVTDEPIYRLRTP